MWDHHSWEMSEVMNEARTRPDKPTREFNAGTDKRAKQNSKEKKMQILQFHTRLEKWEYRICCGRGKKRGEMGKKKNNEKTLLVPNSRYYYLTAVEMSAVCEVR